jgi:hypothetical protein
MMQMKAGARAVITANGSVEIAELVSIRGGARVTWALF